MSELQKKRKFSINGIDIASSLAQNLLISIYYPYQGRLDCIAENISELQKKNQNTLAALAEAKRKQLELSHR